MKKKPSKFWQTERFKDLQKYWDRRLEDSGFEDAEKTINGEKYLRFDQEFYNADNRWEYFDQLEKASRDAVYDSELERMVLNRVIAGVSQPKLIKDLHSLGIKPGRGWSRRSGERFSRGYIRKIIRKYEERWGIRSWKKKPTT